MYYLSLLNQITERSNEYGIQAGRNATRRWGDLEKDGTAPTKSSETSNLPSHFMKSEKTQLSYFLYIKGDMAKNTTELEVALTSYISIVDVE